MSARRAARHREDVRRSFAALLWKFFWTLRWQYFPLLLSDYGRALVRRKYDAIVTDRAYENRPSGWLGPVGALVDRYVLNFPTHVALRQRLRVVVEELKAAARRRGGSAGGEVRILSAPCGLARDLITAASELRESDRTLARLRLVGIDLDETGEVLPLAAERARQAGVEITFHTADLFDEARVGALVGEVGFDVVNCIGLIAWLDLPDVERLVRHFRERLLGADGTLIADNFLPHPYVSLGRQLEINSRQHDPAALAATFERAGFFVDRATTTANGANTVYVLRPA